MDPVVIMQMKAPDLILQVRSQFINIPGIGIRMPHIHQHVKLPVPAQVRKFILVQQLTAIRIVSRVLHQQPHIREKLVHLIQIFQRCPQHLIFFSGEDGIIIEMIDHIGRVQDLREFLRLENMVHTLFILNAAFGTRMLNTPDRFMKKQRSFGEQVKIVFQIRLKRHQVKHGQQFKPDLQSISVPVKLCFFQPAARKHTSVDQ